MPQPRRQRSIAMATQYESHLLTQQLGSTAHTESQHAESSQKGVSDGVRHPPLLKEPQATSPPEQYAVAISTHCSSQSTVQQMSSTLQTAAQQLSLSHPGRGASSGRASKQLPSQGHSQSFAARHVRMASWAQPLSQMMLQQVGSITQTALQQAASLHIGVVLDFWQSPSPGHS